MHSTQAGWLYVAACLAVPAAWGLVSAWIFGRIDARRQEKARASRDAS